MAWATSRTWLCACGAKQPAPCAAVPGPALHPGYPFCLPAPLCPFLSLSIPAPFCVPLTHTTLNIDDSLRAQLCVCWETTVSVQESGAPLPGPRALVPSVSAVGLTQPRRGGAVPGDCVSVCSVLLQMRSCTTTSARSAPPTSGTSCRSASLTCRVSARPGGAERGLGAGRGVVGVAG